MNFIILLTLVIFHVQATDDMTPVHASTENYLRVTAETTYSLGMDKIFDSIKNSEEKDIDTSSMTSFFLKGENPCLTQDPFISLINMNAYNANADILDFAILDYKLYYLSSTSIYELDVIQYGKFENEKHLLNIAGKEFTSIDAFKLSNGKPLLILREEMNAEISYVVLNSNPSIKKLPETPDGFTFEMKLTFFNDYLFIPRKSQGISTYIYMSSTEEFRSNTACNFIVNAYDITVMPSTDLSEIKGYISSYDEGLIPFVLDLNTNKIYKDTTISELANAKVIDWTVINNQHKLMVIQDSPSITTRLNILSVNTEDLINLKYEDIKLLDGTTRYVDVNDKYAAVITGNSLLVIQMGQKSDNIYRYISSEGINNAKFYKTENAMWIIYTNGTQLLVDNVLWNAGYLLCDIGSAIKEYHFSVLGNTQRCGVDEYNIPIKKCYYQANIIMEVSDCLFTDYKEKLTFRWLIAAAILIVVLIILIVAGFRVKKWHDEIKERLNESEQNFKKEEIKGIDKCF